MLHTTTDRCAGSSMIGLTCLTLVAISTAVDADPGLEIDAEAIRQRILAFDEALDPTNRLSGVLLIAEGGGSLSSAHWSPTDASTDRTCRSPQQVVA